MQTYKFKLYNSDKNKYIDESISAAWEIYNHCIALHRRYYRLYGKHLSKNKLQKHIAKLRHKNALWQKLNSQAVQDITDRIERGYKAFFDHVKQHRSGKKSTPHFKKRKDYRSFTRAAGQEAPTSISRGRNARFSGVFFVKVLTLLNFARIYVIIALVKKTRFVYAADNYSKTSNFG